MSQYTGDSKLLRPSSYGSRDILTLQCFLSFDLQEPCEAETGYFYANSFYPLHGSAKATPQVNTNISRSTPSSTRHLFYTSPSRASLTKRTSTSLSSCSCWAAPANLSSPPLSPKTEKLDAVLSTSTATSPHASCASPALISSTV